MNRETVNVGVIAKRKDLIDASLVQMALADMITHFQEVNEQMRSTTMMDW